MPPRGRPDRRITHLKNLAEQIKQTGSLDSVAVEKIIGCLSSSQIPSSGHSTSADIICIDLALHSFGVIMACREHKHLHSQLADIAAALRPDAWKWTQFVLTNSRGEGRYKSVMSAQALKTTLCMLDTLAQFSGMRQCMLDTPGYFDAVLQHWLDEADAGNQWDEVSVLTSILVELLHQGTLRDQSIYQTFQDNSNSIASTAIKHLHNQCERRPLSPRWITTDLELLVELGQYHAPLSALLAAGALPTVVASAQALNSQDASDQDALWGLIPCYTFVGIALAVPLDSRPRIFKAVRCGVLQAIATSSKFIKGLDNDDGGLFFITEIFDRVFAPFMTNSALIDLVAKELRLHPPRGKVFYAPMREPWTQFCSLIDERHKFKEAFDVTFRRSCHACKRDTTCEKDVIKQCGGCAGPRYCSTECQRRDWSLHRSDCLAYQEQILAAEFYPPLHPREKAFLAALSEYEVLTNWGIVKDMFRAKYPSAPLSDMVVDVSWHSCPARLTTRRSVGSFSHRGASNGDGAEPISAEYIRVAMQTRWAPDGRTLSFMMDVPAEL